MQSSPFTRTIGRSVVSPAARAFRLRFVEFIACVMMSFISYRHPVAGRQHWIWFAGAHATLPGNRPIRRRDCHLFVGFTGGALGYGTI